MGFQLYATGAVYNGQSGKNYILFDDADLPFGDEWDVTTAQKILAKAAGIKLHRSIGGKQTIKVLKGIQTMQFNRLMEDFMTMLTMNGSGQLTINSAEHGYLTNSKHCEIFAFERTNVSKATQDLVKHLGKVGLNHMGPTMALMQALQALNKHQSGSKRFRAILNYAW